MTARSRVRGVPPPVSEAWLDRLDAVAGEALAPTSELGPAVAALSRVYTRERGRLRAQEAALAARLRFFLPRDLPKVEWPLAELARFGALPAGRTWRVLDLGAGLGTTHLGVARFAHRTGAADRLEVTAVERDGPSLALAAAVAGAVAGLAVPIDLTPVRADLRRVTLPGGRFDLIVVGLALNELHRDASDRTARRAAWLGTLVDRLAPGGSLVVLEPALREVTRDLQAVRDVLADRVFAPCTRAGPCPLLGDPREWCHTWLPVDLPERLRPVARAAGLRWRGLTFSYLTLRADGRRLPAALRVVDGPRPTKGVTAWALCGPPGRVDLRQLDRHATPGDALDGAARGTLLTVDPVPAPGARLRADRVRVARYSQDPPEGSSTQVNDETRSQR